MVMALSRKASRGIEIEIGGNVTQLKTALDQANRSIKTTKDELTVLKKALKLEWDPTNFRRSQELARRALEQTEAKAEMLRKALAELDKQGKGKNTEQYESIQRELSYVSVAAKKARDQVKEIDDLRMASIREELQKTGKALDGMGNKLTAGVTAPLLAGGGAAVKFASDAQEAVNKAEVAFDSAAGTVKAWSQGTLNAIGLASGTALDMAALFGDMATAMGATDDQAAKMSMTLVDLAADLASFKNISVDQAGTALKAIFTGETETLKNLGVVMTEANLKAYALAEGYATAYDKMDQLEKVQLRYQYVLDQTQNSQGDFSRTFDNTANQLRVCQESLKELAATAGNELLPIVTPLISNVNKLLQSFADLDGETRGNITQFLLFAAALGPALKLSGAMTSIISAAIPVFGALTTALHAKQTADVAATASQTGLNAAMAANPVGALVTALGALVAVLGAFAVSSALVGQRTKDVAAQVRDSRKAYEETAKAMSTQRADAQALMASVTALAEKERKTAQEKAQLVDLVAQLNAAVPELSLAYDEQTDSLSMTTDQLREYVSVLADQKEAEQTVSRLNELETERRQTVEALTAAQKKLREVEEGGHLQHNTGYYLALNNQIKALTGSLEDNAQETATLEERFQGLASGAKRAGEMSREFADAADEAAQATRNAADAAEDGSDGFAELAKRIEAAEDACSLLSTAQEEMTKKGYLSLETVAKLISSGLERYLVEVEGGYRLADGALQDYIGTQQTECAVALNEAKRGAVALIKQYNDETVAINESTAAIKARLQALQAQARVEANAQFAKVATSNDFAGKTEAYMRSVIDNDVTTKYWRGVITSASEAILELDRAQRAADSSVRVTQSLLRDYGSGASKKSGSSSKATGSGKSPAEVELETYKAAVSELDHQRAMDLLSEEDYYEQKSALAQKWLKNNAEEYQAWEEELYAWQSEMAQRQMSALQTALGTDEHQIALLSRSEGAFQAIKDKYQSMMDDVHALAEGFRAQGLAEDSQEIQELQKLWWGYHDSRQALIQDQYQRELDDLDWLHDMELVSEGEYWQRYLELQDTYLEEGSEAWMASQRTLYSKLTSLQDELIRDQDAARKKDQEILEASLDRGVDEAKERYTAQTEAMKTALEERKTALAEAYEADKLAAQERYEEEQALIQETMAEEEKRLSAVLDGIDAEIQARRELREDEDQDQAVREARKRLEAAQAQLSYARTDEDKVQWNGEVARLKVALEEAIRDKDDTALQRERETAAQALKEAQAKMKTAQDDAKANYNAEIDRLEAAYKADVTRAEERYEANTAQAKASYDQTADMLQKSYDASVERLEKGYQAALDLISSGSPTVLLRQYAQGQSIGTGFDWGSLSALVSGALSGVINNAVYNNAQSIDGRQYGGLTIQNYTAPLTEGQLMSLLTKYIDAMSR